MKLYEFFVKNIIRLLMILFWLPVTLGVILGMRKAKEWYPSVKESNKDWVKYFKNPLQQ